MANRFNRVSSIFLHIHIYKGCDDLRSIIGSGSYHYIVSEHDLIYVGFYEQIKYDRNIASYNCITVHATGPQLYCMQAHDA